MKKGNPELNLTAAYKACFNTAAGRTVLANILSVGGIGRSSVEADFDPYKTHFNEGKRRLCLHIGHYLDMPESEMLAMAMDHEEFHGRQTQDELDDLNQIAGL